MNVIVRTNDRFVTVDGLKTRYLEEGSGVPAILLHGSSLGSSADVFRRNLRALGASGIRAIAFDLPGFGKTDPSRRPRRRATGASSSCASWTRSGSSTAALIGHSSSGGPAVSIALEHPDRVSHVMVLGTGSLLPPLEAGGTKVGGREEAAQARLEDRMVKQEPTLADTRALLEANLFHHELITDEELQLRHENSIGRCFTEFVRRHEAGGEGGGKAGGAAVAAPHRAQAAAAADLRPQRPRPRRGTRHAAEAEVSAARSAFRGRLQAPGAVGRRGPVPQAGGAVPDALSKREAIVGRRQPAIARALMPENRRLRLWIASSLWQ